MGRGRYRVTKKQLSFGQVKSARPRASQRRCGESTARRRLWGALLYRLQMLNGGPAIGPITWVRVWWNLGWLILSKPRLRALPAVLLHVSRVSQRRCGASMACKHGGQERSAHNCCTSAPTTSFLERMVQRPGILEKSITWAATRDQCHSVLTRCITM